MRRVVAPSQRCREVDSIDGTVRYKQDKSGAFTMTDRDAKALIAVGGFIQPNMGMGRKAEGYRCLICGFGSWFKVCSRCGGDCEREA